MYLFVFISVSFFAKNNLIINAMTSKAHAIWSAITALLPVLRLRYDVGIIEISVIQIQIVYHFILPLD